MAGEPTTEVRRYVTVLQAREGYPPVGAPLVDRESSPALPEVVSVVKLDDYQDLERQMAARDEHVLDLEAQLHTAEVESGHADLADIAVVVGLDQEASGEDVLAAVERLRTAIAEHKAAIEKAGTVRVFDPESVTKAGLKNHADRTLWATLEGGETP